MKAKVQLMKSERREYDRRDGRGTAVAHNIAVVFADGTMGDLYLGGGTPEAAALYRAAQELDKQPVEITFAPRTFQGRINLSPVAIAPVSK